MDDARQRRNRRVAAREAGNNRNPQDAQECGHCTVPIGELAIDFIIQNIRGPSLAVFYTMLIHPLFVRYSQRLCAVNKMSEPQLFFRFALHINFSVRATLFTLFYLFGRRDTSPTKLLLSAIVNHLLLLLFTRTKLLARLPQMLQGLPSFPRLYLHFALASLLHEALSAAKMSVSRENVGGRWGDEMPLVLPVVTGAVLCHAHPLVCLVWLAWRVDPRLELGIRRMFQGTLLHKLGLLNANAWAFQEFHRKERIKTLGSEFADYMLFGEINHRWLGVGRAEGYLKLSQNRQQEM